MLLLSTVLENGDEVIVRVPLRGDAAAALERADAVYTDVSRELPKFLHLLPESRPLFEVCGWPMHIERRLRGVQAKSLVRDVRSRSRVRRRVAEFVNAMCAATIKQHPVDEAFVASHFKSRFRAICSVEKAFASRLQVVEATVLGLAQGRTMPTVRIHGDLHVNNVFFDPRSVVLTGLIDWETSLPVSLPFDLIHYLISDSREFDPKPWGIQVARAFSGELFDAEANELLLQHLNLLGLPVDMLRPLLIGYWVRGVALRQELSGGRLNPLWRDANLAEPLASIERVLSEV